MVVKIVWPSTVIFYPVIISTENFDAHVQNLSSVEVTFSIWGMPALKATQLAKPPSLQALCYAGLIQPIFL